MCQRELTIIRQQATWHLKTNPHASETRNKNVVPQAIDCERFRANVRIQDAFLALLEPSGRRAVRIVHFRSIAREAKQARRHRTSIWRRLLESSEREVHGLTSHTTGDVTMVKLAAAFKKFVAGEEGASLVEYSLLVALLAAASIAILYGLGQNVKSTYTQVNNAVGTANVGITSAS